MKRKLTTLAAGVTFFAVGVWLTQLAIDTALHVLLFILTI